MLKFDMFNFLIISRCSQLSIEEINLINKNDKKLQQMKNIIQEKINNNIFHVKQNLLDSITQQTREDFWKTLPRAITQEELLLKQQNTQLFHHFNHRNITFSISKSLYLFQIVQLLMGVLPQDSTYDVEKQKMSLPIIKIQNDLSIPLYDIETAQDLNPGTCFMQLSLQDLSQILKDQTKIQPIPRNKNNINENNIKKNILRAILTLALLGATVILTI